MTAAAPSLVERTLAFLDRRPWITDTLFLVLPLTLIDLTMLTVLNNVDFVRDRLWLSVGVSLAMTLPLAVRRVWVVPSAWAVAVVSLVTVVWLAPPTFAAVAVPVVVYTTTKFASRRASRFFFALGMIGSLLLAIPTAATVYLGPDAAPWPPAPVDYVAFAAQTVFAASVVMLAWMLGEVGGRNRRKVEAIEERNRLLIREQAHEAASAATAERLRIAREMHDVISHSLSVMIAQADGGRYAARADPSSAERALATIAATGRTSLTELRRMLGVLRSAEDAPRNRPQPTAADLPDLVAAVQASGLPVEFRSAADLSELPAGLSLAVYRIVQEALTNTLKHAGAQATSQVAIAAEEGDLVVEVVDSDPSPPITTEGTGSGLSGMRERVALYSGTLDAHREAAGFAVRARFPGVGTPLTTQEIP